MESGDDVAKSVGGWSIELDSRCSTTILRPIHGDTDYTQFYPVFILNANHKVTIAIPQTDRISQMEILHRTSQTPNRRF